jgi:hypothetical protein
MRSWFSLSRSDNDQAIRILAQAIWIASLTLASTPPFFVTTGLVRVVHAAMQPTKTLR